MYLTVNVYDKFVRFRYVPDLWTDKLDDLSVSGKKEISEVNVELVHKLKTNDNAFALG